MGEEIDEQSAKCSQEQCSSVRNSQPNHIRFNKLNPNFPSQTYLLGESTTMCQLTTHTFSTLFFFNFLV